MNSTSKTHAEVFDDVEQIVAMNPHLSLEELNIALQHKNQERNNRSNPDFCGLSPSQMTNFLYGSFDELDCVSIRTPKDLSSSPVMRYLSLMLDEAMQNDGCFKATSKGNLPAKLVKQASDLLPEFAVSQFPQNISISEFTGSNEDKFNALHYTRILAEIVGIIYRRSGRWYIKKNAQKQYQSHGIAAFFKPMLEAATRQYNWAYLDSWEQGADLRTFWLFMLWRLQSHASVSQLTDDVAIAFPDLLKQFEYEDYSSPMQLLDALIETRFIERFLQFWGFVTLDPRRFLDQKPIQRKVTIQPLLSQTFHFKIKP